MVKERSKEREMQEMVEIGRKNAELYPKVKAWCRNVEVKMTSSGLLAEMHNLPIGMSKIECDHASAGGHESMHLDYLAESFVLDNCRGCPFHDPVGVDAIGYRIIKEYEEEEAQRREEVENVEVAKARLHDLVSGDLEEALRKEEVTGRSILQLVKLLDHEGRHAEAAKKLVRASEIASELFNPLAVEVISSHFPDPVHGPDCVAVVRNLVARNGEVPGVAFDAAKRCVLERRNADEACMLVGDYVAQRGIVPEPGVVEAVVSSRESLSPFDHGDRPCPGAERALTEIGKLDIASLAGAFERLPSQDHKERRIAAARSVRSLVDSFPLLTLDLIATLIDSLELDDDDDYGDPADKVACQTLAAIYVRHPEEAQRKLEEGYRRASSEAKAILFDVYEYVASGRGRELTEAHKDLDRLYDRATPSILPFLLGVLGGPEHAMEVRWAAAQVLDPIKRGHADALVPHLDTLFGMLANLTLEQVADSENDAEGITEALDRFSRQTQHDFVARQVLECLESVTDLRPEIVLGRLREIVPSLDSKQPHSERYKSRLTDLYGRLGVHREFTPEVIPELYKLLMDFESNSVRGAAVKAIGELLQMRPEEVPQEMLDVLYLYLGDVYVYIHKSAARAMRYVEPKSTEEASRIALSLLALDEVHEADNSFRRDLLRSVIQVVRGHRKLYDPLLVPVLAYYSRSSNTYLAEDALEWLERILPNPSEKQATLFAKEVIAYVGRTGRERYNDETFSGRYQLLMALHDLPKAAIVNNVQAVQETARSLAEDDAYDALRLVHLLSRFELHPEAMQLACEIADKQPRTKRYEHVLRQAAVSGALEGAEVCLSRGDTGTASRILEDAVLLEKMNEKDLASEAPGTTSAFDVAQRIIECVRTL